MPTTELSADDFTDGRITLIDMMVKAKLTASKGEARRLIQQNGVTFKGETVSDIAASFTVADFSEDAVVRKGKKVFHRFTVK